MEIFIRNGQDREGPYSKEQLQTMIDAGNLSRTTLAFHEGLSNWMPVAAVLAPRAKPPPYTPRGDQRVSPKQSPAERQPLLNNPSPEGDGGSPIAVRQETDTTDFTTRRISGRGKFADGIGQIKQIGFETILPIKAAIADKPWNLLWVRWLIVLGLIPLTAMYLANKGDLSTNGSSFLVGIYAAAFWALGLSFILKPERMNIKNLFWFGGIPLLLGIFLLVIAGKVGIVNAMYKATSSESILGRLAAAMAVSLLNQLFIALPLYLRYVRRSEPVPIKTVAFWGFIAGLLYAFAPVSKGLLETQMSFLEASIYGGLQSQSLVGLLASSILTACLGGIVGFFVAFAARNRHLTFGLLLVGLLLPGVLSTVLMASENSILGWGAGLCVLMTFVAHVRTETTTQSTLDGKSLSLIRIRGIGHQL